MPAGGPRRVPAEIPGVNPVAYPAGQTKGVVGPVLEGSGAAEVLQGGLSGYICEGCSRTSIVF